MSKTGYFQYNMRAVVHCAPGSIIRLPNLFAGMGAKRVLLMSDEGLKKVGIVDQVIDVFENMSSGNMPKLAGVYAEVSPDAGCNTINAALAYARQISADAILAVGGGSVMDASKGVKYSLHHNISDFREVVSSGFKMETWPNAQPIPIPHIAVPTTAGTGAEVSAAGVYQDEETDIKCNLAVPFIDADMAVLDANLTIGLPDFLTASTGMDALTHALEGVASPSANHFSDAHSILAAQLIEKTLPTAVKEGGNVDARNDMLQASTMAINGFIASLNAIPVHNCAHAFGRLYHVPHGDANAVLLPIVMEVLPEFYLPNARRLANALNMDVEGSNDVILAAVVERLKALQEEIGCATDFKRWGAKVEDMENIVMAIATDPAALFYPIPPDRIQQIAIKAAGA